MCWVLPGCVAQVVYMTETFEITLLADGIRVYVNEPPPPPLLPTDRETAGEENVFN